MSEAEPQDNLCDVAIVGMAGRFPGAKNVEQLWRNLVDGVESIAFFSDAEAVVSDPAVLRDPHYVKAWGLLEGVDLFDAEFFGIPPEEATVLDPQHRVFLECAWEALEDAGYVPEKYPGRIGVFAGAGASTYERYLPRPRVPVSMAGFAVAVGNHADYVPARASFKLGLRGPSVNVQTACCTSLTAVHLAYQSLLGRECDMALAGGVSILLPQTCGYLYQEGGYFPPDGHCRAFDARAAGVAGGNGVCLVVLKRLEEALADGDFIHAVIKGSALNNDGARKMGFATPGVDGQAEAVAECLATAGVHPETIGYVEAHGVATAMGDPTEVAALTRAFRAHTDRRQYCALGSVKTNVGHLGAAASVTSLVKAALALERGKIPASLHFERPHPQIDFAGSPFFVNKSLRDFEAIGHPRRAGVNAFGLGGTNVFMVLEEVPVAQRAATRQPQLLVLSAMTRDALDAASATLARHLRQHPDLRLADVAYTLQVGRKAFGHRRSVVCREMQDAAAALESGGPPALPTRASDRQTTVFLFPDLETRHEATARELYETEPTFRAHVDQCSDLLRSQLGLELRRLLFPPAASDGRAEQLWQSGLGGPALVAIEYALAQLWMEWGVQPGLMIGAGVGEYVAACLAGVFSLEDALLLACARWSPVPSSPEAPHAASELQRAARKLPSFHLQLEATKLSRPSRRFLSGVTGDWITPSQAIDPNYWVAQQRKVAVSTQQALRALQERDALVLEVGPAQAGALDPLRTVLTSLAPPEQGRSDAEVILGSLGALWCGGVDVNWGAYQAHTRRQRVPLPTYPFQRRRYWAERAP